MQWRTILLVTVACGQAGNAPADASHVDARLADAPISSPDATVPLSCNGLAATCGPDGASACCGSTLVTGGAFYRSYDVGSDHAYVDMTAPATVSDFRLDTYEITVGRFRQFVDAGMGTQADPPSAGAGARTLSGAPNQAGWDPAWNSQLAADTTSLVAAVKCNATYQSWTDAAGSNEALPMNCVTWYEAFAFCAWDGGFLPTEAEWNYAAAGGSEQRAYPWSNPPSSVAIDCSYANFFVNMPQGSYCTNGTTGAVNRVGSESPKGDGAFGQADLAGNVAEWTLDWYESPYATPCDDCADLTPGLSRAFRGYGFGDPPSLVRGAARNEASPDTRIGPLGARCARIP